MTCLMLWFFRDSKPDKMFDSLGFCLCYFHRGSVPVQLYVSIKAPVIYTSVSNSHHSLNTFSLCLFWPLRGSLQLFCSRLIFCTGRSAIINLKLRHFCVSGLQMQTCSKCSFASIIVSRTFLHLFVPKVSSVFFFFFFFEALASILIYFDCQVCILSTFSILSTQQSPRATPAAAPGLRRTTQPSRGIRNRLAYQPGPLEGTTCKAKPSISFS